jgi:N-acyl-phosphatidylethanolamine-hydrolysing phospholipase D
LRYHNPHNRAERNFFHLLLWLLGYRKEAAPPPIPKDFLFPSPPKNLSASGSKVTWMNHSSFLVEVGGITFLTDPIWSSRAGPLVGPKRRHSPPISLLDLPRIDYVLISHNHYDHLDAATIKALHKKDPSTCFIVPQGVGKWFRKRGIHPLLEFSWGESQLILQDEVKITFTAVPAQHFSGRTFKDRNATLWVGYVVEVETPQGKKCFYFCGDSGYNAVDFKALGERWKEIHLSLIPIGAYLPRWFMQPLHINPEEAVKIHQEVGSRLSVGCHFHTFKLSAESMEQPPFDLWCALQEKKPRYPFYLLKPGESLPW